MTSPFELEVSGRLPQALMHVISTRFGTIASMERQHVTVLYGGIADQAALRALLCLIWDSGGSLVSVAVHDIAEDREASGQLARAAESLAPTTLGTPSASHQTARRSGDRESS